MGTISHSQVSNEHRQFGFTLIELLVTLGLIAVLTVVSISVFNSDIDQTRFQQTTAQLQIIRNAMLGDTTVTSGGIRSSFGYLGDIGSIPTAAQGIGALITNPSLPAW